MQKRRLKKEDSALKCIVTKETKEDDDEAAWSFDPIEDTELLCLEHVLYKRDVNSLPKP